MSVNYLDLIPNDIIYYIAINFLTVSDILNLSTTCKRLNCLIYNNESIWRNICKKDLKYIGNKIVESWRDLYKFYSKVWCSGRNKYFELGLKKNNKYYIPKCISNFLVKKVSAGTRHTIFIDIDNNVWVCGDNDCGQLGLGSPDFTTHIFYDELYETRTKIPRLDLPLSNFKATDVSAGANHTAFIDLDNNVWIFGCNHNGELGLGDITNRYSPTKIPNIKAKKIYCGYAHTLIIDMGNNVWTFGYNTQGQLGLGDHEDRHIPTQIKRLKAIDAAIGEYCSGIIDLNNNVWIFGKLNKFRDPSLSEYVNYPIMISYPKAKSIYSGALSFFLIDMDDNVWAFGDNYYGQLGTYDRIDKGIPTKIHRNKKNNSLVGLKARHISSSEFHTIFIDLKNRVWVCGFTRYLELNDSLNSSKSMFQNHVIKIPNFRAIYASTTFKNSFIVGDKTLN